MTDAAAPQWRLQSFAELASTSDLCRTMAEAGEPDGLAVLAGRQTQGRGSRGRAWQSPAGNLSLSILIRPREPVRWAGQWSLLAGVALAEALQLFMPAGSHAVVKWPNDVLLHGRKLAGILLDSVATPAGETAWMVIGMGANLAVAPDLADRPTACLADLGPAPEPAGVARAVLDRIGHWRRVRLLDGFAPIRTAWLLRAQPVGTPITLKRGDSTVGGTFAGLSDDGSLLLHNGGRVHAFATGEVLLPNLPTG